MRHFSERYLGDALLERGETRLLGGRRLREVLRLDLRTSQYKRTIHDVVE